MKKQVLTHAKHDPAHCLAPGLFRSLKKGERKKTKLDVIYVHGENRIEFSGPEPLGADDLRILQGLIAMAGPNGLILGEEPESESGQQLRLLLELKWEAIKEDALVVKGSYRTLASEIGYANLEDSKPIRESIERLWKVSIIVQVGNQRRGFHLLSEYASDATAKGGIFVALNPRITQAIFGNAPYTRIDMHEVRAISSDTTRLIHQRMCGFIAIGKSAKINLDTICGYAWPQNEKILSTEENLKLKETMRKRRQRVRKSLKELETLNWGIVEYGQGKFEITRPDATPLTVPE